MNIPNWRIALITRRDPYANSVKPKEMESFLLKRGYQVDEWDSLSIGRHLVFGLPVPRLNLNAILLYLHELLWAFVRVALRSANLKLLRSVQGRLLNRILRLRGAVLADQLVTGNYRAVICESSLDMAVFLGRRIAQTQILDLPVPWVDEIYYGDQLTVTTYRILSSLQRDCYTAADRVSFHWNKYVDFVESKSPGGRNWLNCSYGVSKKNLRAKFALPPRIVFLGNLEGYWVNLPLLEELCRIYPDLDVCCLLYTSPS